MHVFSGEKVKGFLARLVSDCETFGWTDHHHVAICVVVHDIFKSWFQTMLANNIELNVVWGCHLDTLITPDEVNTTSHIYLFVLDPLNRIPLIYSHQINNLLKKQYLIGATHHEYFIIHEYHLSQIQVCDLLLDVLLHIA